MLSEKRLLYIEETALNLSDWIIQHRRNLHKIPETAWTETKTTAYLKSELQSMGFTIVSGKNVASHNTGLVAELSSGSHPVTALRFDIDGLSVTEETDPNHVPAREHFRSEHEGRMHACGHDGHMAIGLAVAKILSDMRDSLHGTLRLIFQPAEEGCMGAREVVAQGWLADADYFLAGHIVGRDYGQTSTGSSDCVTGVSGSLATSKINAAFNGTSCHGACPENGASAISALCSAVLSLNGIPRNSSGATMINIGRISGGEGRNIVSAHASMELEVRGETTELNQYMEDQALRIIGASATVYGLTADIEIQGKAPSLVSSDDLREQINSLLGNFRHIRISEKGERFKASEDAALMMEETKKHGGKAVFMLFPSDTTAPLHSQNYDFDESILWKAATVISCVVADLMS